MRCWYRTWLNYRLNLKICQIHASVENVQVKMYGHAERWTLNVVCILSVKTMKISVKIRGGNRNIDEYM